MNGPSPILHSADVAASTTNYKNVEEEILSRASFRGETVDWYQVAVAGYGYVDEQCDDYLDKLRTIKAARDTTRAQLASFGTTTNTILGVVAAGSKAIAVTAAAFGLASQISDNATASLLYAMDPSDIQDLVRNQTREYRRAASQQQSTFANGTVAMDSIRGYLNLCLPVSIEGQVKAAVRNTVYVAATSPSGIPELAQYGVGSPLAPSIDDLRHGEGTRGPERQASDLAKGLTAKDMQITLVQARVVQANLCLKPTGDLGAPTSPTRSAIKELQTYTAAADNAGQAIPATGNLDQATLSTVLSYPDCQKSGHRNVFEQVKLRSPDLVRAVQKALLAYAIREDVGLPESAKAIANQEGFVSPDGKFTDANRQVIEAIETKLGKPPTGTYTQDIQNKILS